METQHQEISVEKLVTKEKLALRVALYSRLLRQVEDTVELNITPLPLEGEDDFAYLRRTKPIPVISNYLNFCGVKPIGETVNAQIIEEISTADLEAKIITYRLSDIETFLSKLSLRLDEVLELPLEQ